MAKKFGYYGLKEKLTVNKLINKVGGVYFKPSKSGGKIASGIQRGANLKKTLINIAKGKSAYTANRELQIKYGVALRPRKKIMDLIEDGKKNGLTKEQIEKNLNRAQRERIDEPETTSKGETYTKKYAGGREVESHGVMKDIGVDIEKRGGKIGFAANYKNSNLSDNSAPKTPSAGTKPLGM